MGTDGHGIEKIDNPVYPDMDVETKRNLVDEILWNRKNHPGIMGVVAPTPVVSVIKILEKMNRWFSKK